MGAYCDDLSLPVNSTAGAPTNELRLRKHVYECDGNIYLDPICMKLIHTEKLRRFRELHAVSGGTRMVYPGAVHSRFDADSDRYDLQTVRRAGILHGPFSHTFEREFLPRVLQFNDENDDEGDGGNSKKVIDDQCEKRARKRSAYHTSVQASSSGKRKTEDSSYEEERALYADYLRAFMMCPKRSEILRQYPYLRNTPKTVGFDLAEKLVGDERFKSLSKSKRHKEKLRFYDTSGVMLLHWKPTPLDDSYLSRPDTQKRMVNAAGPIRDQLWHKLCWAYTLCDLISATLVLYGWEEEYKALCPWYLCTNVCPHRRDRNLKKLLDKTPSPDLESENTHSCYGSSVERGLWYVQKEGIPEENISKFNCNLKRPKNSEEKMHRIRDVFQYPTLDEALRRLKTHAVSASLMIFEGWDEREIYRGPINGGAKVEAVHSVLMLCCEKINEEMVVRCKSSNGSSSMFEGYIYVSLEVMMMIIATDEGDSIYREPQYLLTKFFSVDMETNPRRGLQFSLKPSQVERNSKFKVSLKVYDVYNKESDEEDSTTEGTTATAPEDATKLGTVNKALCGAGLEKSQIDEIVLAGGSTRIPKVQQLLKDFCEGKEPIKGINVNPDEAVAYGDGRSNRKAWPYSRQFLALEYCTGKGRELYHDLNAYRVLFDDKMAVQHSEKTVDFELTLSEANMMKARQEGILKKFKLTTTVATTNMHLFAENGVIKKYATPEEILEEFFDLRLQYYEKRKRVMLENLEEELLKLENKVKFILGVVSGEIKVNNRKKADLVQELRQRGFTPFPKKAKPVEAAVAGAIDATEEESEESSGAAPATSSMFISGSDYDYLLAMAISSLTLEKVEELCAQRDKMKEEVEELKKTTRESLWLKDLDSLDMALDNIDAQDEEDRIKAAEDAEKAAKKDKAGGGAAKKGRKPAARKPPAPKKTTKKESETAEASTNSAMDTESNVVEVVKPKVRQAAAKKKATVAPPAAEVDDDVMLDLAERIKQYNISKETAETSKAISLDDDDDDAEDVVVVEAAPAKAASKAAKPLAAPRKRGPAASKKQQEPVVEVVGVSPVKKVRKMRSSPFNKKSGSVVARLATTSNNNTVEEEGESSESVVAVKTARPLRANRKQMRYVLSDSESESGNDSEFEEIEDDEDDE